MPTIVIAHIQLKKPLIQ